ncbi:cytochrome c556 [Beggiatoa alba B18LD]|uniref:Cytochrome c556 n=1 Tax=Beggiatoa alba B18LD TaxID=395493 RepID=I3CID7_9GAMM|nr:cytochrome c [Beggiatoa alba]EIJ43380.1 cytochrome c556 [Beggiatoa alba B18LD]
MLKLVKMSIAGLLAVGISTSVLAAEDPIHDAIEYRKGAFSGIAWNFKRMAGMVKGEIPFNAEEFAKRAGYVATLAQLPLEGFKDLPDSAMDKSKTKTAAKPEIWKDWADFEKDMKALEDGSAKLAEVAKKGDLDAIKPVFAEVGKTCKGCHDEFKEKHEH